MTNDCSNDQILIIVSTTLDYFIDLAHCADGAVYPYILKHRYTFIDGNIFRLLGWLFFSNIP